MSALYKWSRHGLAICLLSGDKWTDSLLTSWTLTEPAPCVRGFRLDIHFATFFSSVGADGESFSSHGNIVIVGGTFQDMYFKVELNE